VRGRHPARRAELKSGIYGEEAAGVRENGHVFLKSFSGFAHASDTIPEPGVRPVPTMKIDTAQTVTRLLHAWSDGDLAATEQLLPIVYEQLRALAREFMRRERPGHTLQPTALVHEAYLRLTDGAAVAWQGRAHFYSVASRAMRRILVDHARARQVRQRGDFQERAPFEQVDDLGQPAECGDPDILALNGALERLAQTQPRRSRVVELRFFGGMNSAEIAEALNISEKTVLRDWQVAKIWLHRALGRPGD
jgi:RNA polymerase sigma-70 factor (ECF subfamily)